MYVFMQPNAPAGYVGGRVYNFDPSLGGSVVQPMLASGVANQLRSLEEAQTMAQQNGGQIIAVDTNGVQTVTTVSPSANYSLT